MFARKPKTLVFSGTTATSSQLKKINNLLAKGWTCQVSDLQFTKIYLSKP